MSQLKVNSIVDANGGSSAVLYGVASPPNSMGFRNRIINGDHTVNQNGITSLSPSTSGVMLTDLWTAVFSSLRFAFIRNWASASAPTGFTDYLTAVNIGATTLAASDFWTVRQNISGYNIADLNWGTANAQAVTLSFWARSNQTGTFGGALQNSAATRSYPFSYTINAANTWQYVTITIPGDTTGTWLTNDGTGIALIFCQGAGSTFTTTAGAWAAGNFVGVTGQVQLSSTSNANFIFTGVQLEAGSAASPYERIAYGNEVGMCQDYGASTGTPLPSYRCRAWVNFDGAAATPSIRASGNVSSITDSGTGLYIVNFTTAMPDANYAMVCTARATTDASTSLVLAAQKLSGVHSTAASQVATHVVTTPTDSSEVQVAFFR